MARKPKAPPTPEPTFPIFLGEEDQLVHLNWLVAQQRAMDELHNQLLRFLLPQQQDLAEKWARWWDRLRERHGIPPDTPMEVRNVGRAGGWVDRIEPKPGTSP